jgi:hypothetical protein
MGCGACRMAYVCVPPAPCHPVWGCKEDFTHTQHATSRAHQRPHMPPRHPSLSRVLHRQIGNTYAPTCTCSLSFCESCLGVIWCVFWAHLLQVGLWAAGVGPGDAPSHTHSPLSWGPCMCGGTSPGPTPAEQLCCGVCCAMQCSVVQHSAFTPLCGAVVDWGRCRRTPPCPW